MSSDLLSILSPAKTKTPGPKPGPAGATADSSARAMTTTQAVVQAAPHRPETFDAWVPAAYTLAIFAFVGVVLQFCAKRWGKRLIGFFAGRYGDMLLDSVVPYTAFWVTLAGLATATATMPLAAHPLTLMREAVVAIFILSASLSLAGLGGDLVHHVGGRLALGSSHASLSRTLVRCVILVLGVITVLSQLGIAMGPLLTTLGIGSLAVALALQDTFANFFAGFYVMASHQVQVGDFLKLDSGQEGYVDDISWRSCRLVEINGNYIILPNQKLAQAIVYNYDRPNAGSVVMDLKLSYHNDLALVERITCEIARQVLQAGPDPVGTPQPFVRYKQFAEGVVGFSVILKIKPGTDRFLLTHEFMKQLHARYVTENITMAGPWSDVHLGPPVPPAQAT